MNNIDEKAETEQEFTFYLNDLKDRISESYRKRSSIRSIFSVYLFVGLATATASLLYFILSFYKFDLEFNQTISLTFAGVGTLVALLARYSIEHLKEKEKENDARKKQLDNISNFIVNWSTLERVTRMISQREDSANSKFAISRNLAALQSKNHISRRELFLVEKLLDVRNVIVHGNANFSIEDLEKYNVQLEEIINKLLDESNV